MPTSFQLFPTLFLLFLFPFAHSAVSFNISRFDSNAANIIYEGDAEPSVGAIEFNSLTYLFQVGRATYHENLRLWDPPTQKLTDFATHFTFIIDTRGRTSYAAGLAFFLAPVGFRIPVNSGGGFLGLFNTTTSDSSQNQIVLVEFDSFANAAWDPPVGHVGINRNSIASAVYTPWNASFHSGDTADAWITYNATTKNLSVSWAYKATSNPQENSSLSYQIDLMKVLPEWVIVGFSAATSHYMERHQLFSWEFSSNLDSNESNKNSAEKMRLVYVIGVPVLTGAVVAGAIIVFAILRRRKQKRRKTVEKMMNLASINEDLERGAGPRRFSYAQLASATNSFSNERKLGEGGFGAVFRGYLPDLDMSVAVKKISRGSKQGKKEYVTEVKIISQLRHRNLVQLMGWCHERGEFLLVYEFMPNGSLDSHLFGKKSPLTWSVRYGIATGLASSLLYLHEEWEQCVVHRDIKSSNVMLNSDFNAKLGDFGLARLMNHELGPKTTGLAGTFGYLAPEYIRTGRACKESDVYSFGIVALEIVTGRKSVSTMQEYEMGLLEWVWGLYGTGNLLSAVDKRLHIEFDHKQVECLMIVGLWCAHPDHNKRASIRQAIQVLNFEAPIPNLPTKMPVPIFHAPTACVTSGENFITNSSLEVGR